MARHHLPRISVNGLESCYDTLSIKSNSGALLKNILGNQEVEISFLSGEEGYLHLPYPEILSFPGEEFFGGDGTFEGVVKFPETVNAVRLSSVATSETFPIEPTDDVHLVIVWRNLESSSEYDVYVNSVLVNSLEYNDVTIENRPILFFSKPGFSGLNFRLVRLYDRQLSSEEVKTNYYSTLRGK